ncbi:MAG: TetR/AcrR family transcriptional regulator [Phenylobacterium sp.]
MSRRSYTQDKRAEAAEETRRRIVQATFELHGEQGIAATSMKQIAQRAGVGVGTVYHHFPTYDDAITACGGMVLAIAPPPDRTMFDGLNSARERIAAAVRTFYARYRQVPMIETARAEQQVSPALQGFFAAEAQGRAQLAREAVGPADEGGEVARLAAGLLDIGVCSALARAGLSPEAADRLVADFIGGRLPPDAP